MAVDTLTQIVTVALGALAIIWHQQRTTDKLHDGLDSVEQRLARIEGFLGIGVSGGSATLGGSGPVELYQNQ